MSHSPTSIPTEALVDPSAAWSAWTMTQRRELLRLLFAGIAVKHVGRLDSTWASSRVSRVSQGLSHERVFRSQRHTGAMVASWVQTERSNSLSGRKSKDTEPEVLLRKALHAAGARFQLHRRIGHGCTPDIVLPGRWVAVFVDGDFWHGCPTHFPARRVRGPNAELWEGKFEAVRERDRRSTRLAEEAGWRVLRVWECEIRADAASVAAQVLACPVVEHKFYDTRHQCRRASLS